MVQLTPNEEGIDTYCSIVYPTKKGNDSVIAYQRTKQRRNQFNDTEGPSREFYQSKHWKHVQILLFIDEQDERPHRVLDETSIMCL